MKVKANARDEGEIRWVQRLLKYLCWKVGLMSDAPPFVSKAEETEISCLLTNSAKATLEKLPQTVTNLVYDEWLWLPSTCRK